MPKYQTGMTSEATQIVATVAEGHKGFIPSGLMIETIAKFMQTIDQQEVIAPYAILKQEGHAVANWYKWVKRKGFLDWWGNAMDIWHKSSGLSNVHNALYRHALGNSPQDRKTYLERFDEKYRPTTKTEIDAYPGQRPADAIQASQERIKAVKSRLVGEGNNV